MYIGAKALQILFIPVGGNKTSDKLLILKLNLEYFMIKYKGTYATSNSGAFNFFFWQRSQRTKGMLDVKAQELG